MYSQSNEDEIIADLLAHIGVGRRRFIEFGAGDGRQNNTINLVLQGWNGIWYEPHKRRMQSAVERWAKFPDLKIFRRKITPEKVNVAVKDPIDFLSIDIDGNDYAVWEACTARPRLLCIEYDAVNGSSLSQMVELGERKGYALQCTSSNNVNAFFLPVKPQLRLVK